MYILGACCSGVEDVVIDLEQTEGARELIRYVGTVCLAQIISFRFEIEIGIPVLVVFDDGIRRFRLRDSPGDQGKIRPQGINISLKIPERLGFPAGLPGLREDDLYKLAVELELLSGRAVIGRNVDTPLVRNDGSLSKCPLHGLRG